MSARILIIEDEDRIRQFLQRGLSFEGYRVDAAADGQTGLDLFRENPPDLVLLDLMLPGMDGLEVCRRIRAASEVPILMLTAKETIEDRVVGLDAGADDYLVKPFELQEVEARLNVLAGRGRRRSRRELKVGDLKYNLDTLDVCRGDEDIYLNPIGLKLLHCLMESSPNVVSRSDLEMKVWGEEMPDSDSLRVHIHSLRSAIDKPFGSNMIQTRHGIGYRLVESDAVSP